MKNRLICVAKRSLALLMIVIMVLSFTLVVFAEGKDPVITYGNINKSPAGTYGYLIVKDGEFNFALENSGITKYEEARFFGVDYDLKKGIPSKEAATNMAKDLNDSGVNLVRLKDVYAVLANDDNFPAFDAFVFELYLKGIYIECDMFSPSLLGTDSVGAFANEDAISKAIRFLRKFFNHVGPNDKIYALDEMLVAVKYISESSVSYIQAGQSFSSAATLKAGFNTWLQTKYKTTDALKVAWTSKAGVCALVETEVIGSVEIGSIGTSSDVLLAADNQNNARQADFNLYLMAVQKDAFQRIYSAIRGYGYRSVIMCSDASAGPFSTILSGIGDAAAKTIRLANNAPVQDALKAAVSGSVAKKPYVLNWDTGASYTNKTAVLTELVVYGCLQGWDSLILGEYVINPAEGQYSVNRDEEIWKQAGLFASIFRYRLLTSSRSQIDYVYTSGDLAAETGNFGKIPYLTSYISKVGVAYAQDSYVSDSGFAISAGNVSGGDYSKTKNKLLLQSFSNLQDPAMKGTDKASWYNSHVEKKMSKFDIGGVDVRIGDNRAIAVDGVMDSTKKISDVMMKLGLIQDPQGEKDGKITSDSDQIVYDEVNNAIYAMGNKVSVFSGKMSSTPVKSGSIEYSGDGKDSSVIVYPVDKQKINSSYDMLIYARGSSATDKVNATMTFLRENCTYKFYGITEDGKRSDELLSQSPEGDKSGVAKVQLDGKYKAYELVFIEKDVDTLLEGYDVNSMFPTRPNLLLLISIPALIFLVLAYAGILLMDKLKWKREERLRLATMETKTKNRIAHNEHMKKFEEEMKQDLKDRKKKDMESTFGYNPLLDDDIPEDLRNQFNDDEDDEVK